MGDRIYSTKELTRAARSLVDELDATRQLERDIAEWRYFQSPIMESRHGEEGLMHAEAEAEEHLDALASRLEQAFWSAQAFLEMAGLSVTRADVASRADGFRAEGFRELKQDSYRGERYVTSAARHYLSAVLNPVLLALGATPPTRARLKSSRRLLNDLLRDTATIVQTHGELPAREHDVQRIMHRLLKAVFPSFSDNVTFPKSLKSFRPDCAVASLGTAIEFKFADTMKEIANAFEQLCADFSGYAGSKDFPCNVAVVYQTAAFISERQLNAAIAMTGHGKSWDIIVVTGGGGRVPKKRAKSPAPGPSER